MEFLKLLRRMGSSTICQVVMATHSPMLMAYPNARLLRLSKYGLEPVTVEQTDHYCMRSGWRRNALRYPVLRAMRWQFSRSSSQPVRIGVRDGVEPLRDDGRRKRFKNPWTGC